MKISARGGLIPPSPIRKLAPYADKAKADGVVVHHLNIGQPDVPTPPGFFEAIRNYSGSSDFASARAGKGGAPKGVVIGYGHSLGSAPLRDAMAAYYRRLGYDVLTEDVMVTTGGSEAILFALTAICDPGDEVIVFEPFYTNYAGFAAEVSVTLKPVRCLPETGYHLPRREVIEAAIGRKTRAIMLCSPNNPTGAVFTRDELQLLVTICKERDLYLVADEVYREFVYGEVPHTSVLAFPEIEDRVVLLDSLSKRYSVCGARIGCIVTKNRDLSRVFLQLGQARLCPPSLEQAGALALMSLGAPYFAEVQAEYRRRRDASIAALKDIPGVAVRTPEGAFYLMARLPVRDAERFATWMLTDFRLDGQTVMVAPGEGFYATPGLGRSEIRIAYVLEVERLQRAMKCLRAGLAAFTAKEGWTPPGE
jgi:aspartate aminotransferase